MMPKESKSEDRAYTRAEIQKMIVHCEDITDKVIIIGFSSGGFRLEAWNYFTWSDVVFFKNEDGFVTVVTSKVSTACGVNFIKGKEYLIYAKIDGNTLYTSTCDGSWFLDGRADDLQTLNDMGTTHHFVDAREIKGLSSSDCRGPGLMSFEECEFEKLVRTVFLPIGVALPIVGVSAFFIWRKRK